MSQRLVIHFRHQKGAALLAIMIIFVVASSYALVSSLNANVQNYGRVSSSLDALNAAKAALIGYAIRFPEIDALSPGDPIDGPGYLPCPDIVNNGGAGTSCSIGGGTTIGRFPWATLDISELRDAAGERLWYAVSDNYKNNPKVLAQLNSDSPGNFSVDGNNDIVAVIFAPGAPVSTQDRSDDPLDVANYLEDDNANGDVNFVTRATNDPAVDFNDALVTITRQELMTVVERRVLGEVDEALSIYQTDPDYDDVANVDPDCGIDPACDNAFPWLSPFSDPSTSSYRSTINTKQGHIPFHWSADPNSIDQGGAVTGRNPFTTSVEVVWDNISNATANVNNYYPQFSITTQSVSCLNDINDCDEGGTFSELTSLSPAAEINCTWSDRNTADCDSFSVSVVGVYSIPLCPSMTITRTYTINFPSITGVSSIDAPTTTERRLRDITLTASGTDYIPAQTLAIEMRDVIDDLYVLWSGSCYGPFGTYQVAYGSSTFNATTQGTISVNNINFDIDTDGIDSNADGDYVDAGEVVPELPEWFVENGWHELIYIAYPIAEALPGGTTACTVGTDCLTVNVDGTVNNNVRATAISAGMTLAGQDRVTTPDANDFFDNVENTNTDDIFLKSRTTTTYNDQTRIISTTP